MAENMGEVLRPTIDEIAGSPQVNSTKPEKPVDPSERFSLEAEQGIIQLLESEDPHKREQGELRLQALHKLFRGYHHEEPEPLNKYEANREQDTNSRGKFHRFRSMFGLERKAEQIELQSLPNTKGLTHPLKGTPEQRQDDIAIAHATKMIGHVPGISALIAEMRNPGKKEYARKNIERLYQEHIKNQ